MPKRTNFGLGKSKVAALHKKMEGEYAGLAPNRIDEEYERLKARYDALQSYVEKNKSITERLKENKRQQSFAAWEMRRSQSDALKQMNVFKAIATSWTGKVILTDEYQRAQKQLEALRKNATQLEASLSTTEVSERKQLYYRLQVLRNIRREQKEARMRALANAKIKNVRASSASLKKKAKKASSIQRECPYCVSIFSIHEMVLDHIYPIAEGGLDTEKNTVLVCFGCNSKKSDLTLRAFAKKYKFDFERICARLDELGKQI